MVTNPRQNEAYVPEHEQYTACQHRCVNGGEPVCRDWSTRAEALFGDGTSRPPELEALLQEAEQFLWGPADVRSGTLPLLERLEAARAWVAQVRRQ